MPSLSLQKKWKEPVGTYQIGRVRGAKMLCNQANFLMPPVRLEGVEGGQILTHEWGLGIRLGRHIILWARIF